QFDLSNRLEISISGWPACTGVRFSSNIVLACAILFWASVSEANPLGGHIAGGSATITQPSPSTLNVIQHTGKVIIDWKSFNIASGEHTNFQQPSASAIALNRVGGGASMIDGRLTANGRLFLINPNGVVFGKGSRVNVGSLVATTADIRNEDFLAGRYRFDLASDNPDEGIAPSLLKPAVINRGEIHVSEGGAAVLAAPLVRNEGLIQARLGQVNLAGTNTFTLDFHGDGLLQFKLGSNLGDVRPIVRNEAGGRIFADGGRVALSAQAAGTVVHGVINMDGIVEARAVTIEGGDIVLSPGVLEGLPQDTDLNVLATNDININLIDQIDRALNLQATTGKVTFNADTDGNGSGSFLLNSTPTLFDTAVSLFDVLPSPTVIETQGGSLTIDAAKIESRVGESLGFRTNGGDISINSRNDSIQSSLGLFADSSSKSTAGGNIFIGANGELFVRGINASGTPSGNITLQGDEINLAGGDNSVVAPGGQLLIQSRTPGQNIVFGKTNDSDSESDMSLTTTLDLTTQDYAAIANDFSSVTIGRNNGFGTITVSAPQFLNHSTTFQSPGGRIAWEGATKAQSNDLTLKAMNISLSPISFFGDGGDFSIMGDLSLGFGTIQTGGGNFSVLGNTTLKDDVTINTAVGNIDFRGTINGTNFDNGEGEPVLLGALTLNAGKDSIKFGGDVGVLMPLNSVTVLSANDITIGGRFFAGDVSFLSFDGHLSSPPNSLNVNTLFVDNISPGSATIFGTVGGASG
ncbi:MAG: filamentous hemagglutinin N-terminal domain-containing protein, partial [Deltaproteobacteria bacterium]|nr:filamentous hemagglutinin N-terminal domain-containing protein [Deltaproteobacteria bacterium]